MSQIAIPDRAAVRGQPPLYFVVGLAFGILADNFVYPLPYEPRWVGWLFIGIGVIVSVLAALQFRANGENPMPNSPTHALIDTGPYRFSRNPMYLITGLIQAGISMLVGTWWGILMVIPVWVVVHYLAILPEEQYLEHKLGEEYLEYKKRVRRWI